MKTFMTGLLKGRVTRRNMLAAVLPAAGLSLAWADDKSDRGRFRLGGAFIGSDETGLLFQHVQIPLNPEGTLAAVHVPVLSYPQAIADLLTAFGADTSSDFVGQIRMTSSDTAKLTITAHALASGNPPVSAAISLISASLRFTDPDTIVLDYTLAIYPPSPDGLPHGSPLLGPLPAAPATLKRVPLV